MSMKPEIPEIPEIRAATVEDAASVCQVLRRSIAECCTEDHRNDSTILSAWLGNKTPSTIEAWFRCSGKFPVVAVLNNEIVGVAMLTRQGKIVLCHVIPEVRFTGIGKALLQALESQAKEWGLLSLQLVSTVTAKSFCQRNGYIQSATPTSMLGFEAFTFSKRLCTSYPQKSGCRCG